MDEYKIINVYLFRPSFKNVKQRCEVLSCDACDRCGMYKQGKCVVKDYLFESLRCPHSALSKEEGYTNRARNYYSWFEKKEKQYGDDLIDKLEFVDEKLCIVGGDYVYLPYPYLHNYINKIEGIVNDHFIPLKEFDEDKIKEIFDFVPMTLFDHKPIESYQEECVPKFAQHLKEVMPNRLYSFLSKYPEYKDKIDKIICEYVGRTAYIRTMTEGSVLRDCHGDEWTIDNGYLVCKNNDMNLIPFIVYKESTEVKIKISENMTYKITSNDQVNENTVFVD